MHFSTDIGLSLRRFFTESETLQNDRGATYLYRVRPSGRIGDY